MILFCELVLYLLTYIYKLSFSRIQYTYNAIIFTQSNCQDIFPSLHYHSICYPNQRIPLSGLSHLDSLYPKIASDSTIIVITALLMGSLSLDL